MTNTLDARDFQARLQQLDGLLQEADRVADPATRARLQQIVQAILDLHGMGLNALLEHVRAAGHAGRSILKNCGKDDMVSGMLLLHELHPLNVEERVQQALESVRPYLRSHGGNVELVELCGGVARLRLQGSCHHCPSSELTMQQTVEEAIFGKAPEVTVVEVEELEEQSPTFQSESARVALTVV